MDCPKCNAQNTEQNKFCTACGEPLQAQTNDQIRQDLAEADFVEVALESETNNPQIDSRLEASPSSQPKKKPWLMILLILIGAVVLLAGAGILAKTFLFKTDQQVVEKALNELKYPSQLAIEGQVRYSDFELEGGSVLVGTIAGSIIENIKMNYDLRYDAAQLVGQYRYKILFNQEELISLDMILTEDYIALHSPILHEKTLYLKWEDYQKMAQDYDLPIESRYLIDSGDTNYIKSYLEVLDPRNYDQYEQLEFVKMADRLTTKLLKKAKKTDAKSLLVAGYEQETEQAGEIFLLNWDLSELHAEFDINQPEQQQSQNIIFYKQLVEQLFDQIKTNQDVGAYNQLMTIQDQDAVPEIVSEWTESTDQAIEQSKQAIITQMEQASLGQLGDDNETSYNKEMLWDLLKQIYQDFKFQNQLVIEQGKVKAIDTQADIVFDTDKMKQSQVSPVLDEDLEKLPSFKMKIKVNASTIFNQINQPIEVRELAADAINIGQLSEVERGQLIQEIEQTKSDYLMKLQAFLMGTLQ